MMEKKEILGYIVCGVVMVGSWLACFLPTFFYLNPVKLPNNVKQNLPPPNTSLITQFPVPSFPCNPPLIYSNKSGFCKPACDWLPFPDYQQDAMATTDWVTAAFCITSFFIVLVTWFKIPEFVKFPHIIILLMAGTGALVEILVIIPKFADRTTFFCSSKFLDEAVANPTRFCQAQGSLIYYISLVTAEMFVVYNTMLFKNLVIDKLPVLTVDKKWLTFASLLGILLPIIPVVYVLKSGTNYVPMYSRYCFPGDKDTAFNLVLIPQQICLCIGVTCLIAVIFKLIKERKTSLIGSQRHARTRQQKLQRVMIHFIMVIISYILCVYLTYGVICISMANGPAYEKTIQQYFMCLIFSANCPKDFMKYETSFTVLILSFLAGNIFQLGTLVLLAGKPKTRRLWRSWLCLTKKRRETKEKSSNAIVQATKKSRANEQDCETDQSSKM